MIHPDDHKCAKRENVREAILDAIGRLIERLGYHKTTVEDIAEEAGIGKGTVYLHFASKEEIAAEWLDRIHGEIEAGLKSAAAAQADPVAQAKAILVARVLLRFDRFAAYPLSLEQMVAGLKPMLAARKERFHGLESQMLAAVLAKIGDAKPEAALAAAGNMIVATNSLLPYSLKVQEIGDRTTVEDRIHGIADLLLAGYIHLLSQTQ